MTITLLNGHTTMNTSLVVAQIEKGRCGGCGTVIEAEG